MDFIQLLVALAACCVVSARLSDVSFDEHARVGKGLLMPLKVRQGVARGLLRNGTLPVLGGVKEIGYFYTELLLGTPARKFSVIIDTGSTITYIPCSNCQHCGTHMDAAFDITQSSSVVELGCSHSSCMTACGSPACSCRDQKCYYYRSYAEQSTSEGWLLQDTLQFPDDLPDPVRVVFGCENGESGEIYRQLADGIMGMGDNSNAFQSQLVASGVIDDVFSLCFGYSSKGALLLGDVPLLPGMTPQWTPLLRNHGHYYNVDLRGFTVGGTRLSIPESVFSVGYGSVLDSGTTFTYLPTAAYNAFTRAIQEAAERSGVRRRPAPDPQYNDICWTGAPEQYDALTEVFPIASMVMGGGVELQLTPMRYLFNIQPGDYCLAMFDNGGSGALLGAVSVRNVLVQYDRRNVRVGFVDARCDTLQEDIRAMQQSGSQPAPGPTPSGGQSPGPGEPSANPSQAPDSLQPNASSFPSTSAPKQYLQASFWHQNQAIVIGIACSMTVLCVAGVLALRWKPLRSWLYSMTGYSTFDAQYGKLGKETEFSLQERSSA